MAKIRKLFDKAQKDYFEKIYRAYFDRLFAYALVITKSEILAKDVVSDVFFNLWNTQTDLSAVKDLKSYLFTSAKNQAIRTLSHDPIHFDLHDYKQATSSIEWINPEELLVGKELDNFLDKVISQLPPQCGIVFRKIKENNKKYDEVAAELDISVDTVKYHLKTALKKIKVELEIHFKGTRTIDWFSASSIILISFETLFSF